MDLSKNEVMAMMKIDLDSNMNLVTWGDDLASGGNATDLSCYGYWRDFYYPTVIHDSYPVYIRERARDKGKQAFEIIKILKDKKLVKLDKVADFIDLMDELIKIL